MWTYWPFRTIGIATATTSYCLRAMHFAVWLYIPIITQAWAIVFTHSSPRARNLIISYHPYHNWMAQWTCIIAHTPEPIYSAIFFCLESALLRQALIVVWPFLIDFEKSQNGKLHCNLIEHIVWNTHCTIIIYTPCFVYRARITLSHKVAE